jgi:hypothetical protein
MAIHDANANIHHIYLKFHPLKTFEFNIVFPNGTKIDPNL